MTILVTGAAGFIGYHVCVALLERDENVIGVDNLNDYYDVSLKESRLELLNKNNKFLFYPIDISDKNEMDGMVASHPEIDGIIHLAAQAGVRYSLENPFAYVQSNLVGHVVMLEISRNMKGLKHFVYASSSSVYGGNENLPFSVEDKVDSPISLYAATKKSDELMTHSYSHLYAIPSTGLRFFTVYGPWGRPDMAAFLFTKAILAGEPIKLFNHGDMKRDFTYIDDIVDGVLAALDNPPQKDGKKAPYKIYNLGNNKSENLMYFIKILEQVLDKKVKFDLMPMQDGDMKDTYANIDAAANELGFSPKTSLKEGLQKFTEWYKKYYKI